MLFDNEIAKKVAQKDLLEMQAEATTEAEQAWQEVNAALNAPEYDRDRYMTACMEEADKAGYLRGIKAAISLLKATQVLFTNPEMNKEKAA